MNLRTRRKELQKSMSDIAKEVGVSIQTISRWETEALIPPMNHLKSLAKGYELDVEILRKSIIAKMQGNSAGYSGDENIIATLDHLAKESSQMKEKVIIHSFSTRGFLTTKNSNVALSVCQCAEAGIEIVYLCLPSSLRCDNIEKEDPDRTIKTLQHQFEDSIKYWRSIGHQVNKSGIYKHLWTVSPSREVSLGEIGRIYGNLIKPLIIIQTQRDPHPTIANNKHWSKIIPEHFLLRDIWVHTNEEGAGDTDVPRWLNMDATKKHHQEYYDVITSIRENNKYELSPLMKD